MRSIKLAMPVGTRKLLAIAITAAFTSMPLLAASAQEPAGRKEEEKEATTLAALTVTAQKREEAMQDVPIAITALPEQLLQDTGVRDVKDMQVLVPGLTVTSTQSEAQTTVRIRGIGTVGDNAGLESSVGVLIDGVYRPRNGVGFGDLGEIERIEVLKGPQGTVFGKNTSAGVVNVITKHPHYETEAQGELTVGNYNAVGVSGAFNTALGESAAFRVYAAKRKRDGYNDVRTGAGPRTETEDGDQNFHTLRGQLLFEPTDTLDINLSADFTSREENCCVGLTTVRGATAAIIDSLSPDEGVAPVADPFARVAYSNRSTEQDIKDKGVAAEVNWITPWFDGATLTSITAWRDWGSINGLDFDFSSADLLYRNPEEDESFTGFETFSQEFRLTGSTDRVDWMFGAFYSDEDLDRNETYRIGSGYEPYLSVALLSMINPALGRSPTAPLFLSQASGRPPGTVFAGFGANDVYRQNAKSAALFTNNTWHATDALDLTLGLRYTREDKELDSNYANPNGSPGCSAMLGPGGQARVAQALLARGVPAAALPQVIPQVIGFSCLPWANPLHNGRVTHQESEEKEWSGTLKVAYRFNDHVMGYVSGARGYKAGGFNLDRVQSNTGLSSGGSGILPVNDTSFPGEFVDSYELGSKTTWADGNLLANATLFHQTYEDFQLNSFLGTSFVVRSIPEVVSKGIDTELLWQATKGLMVQGGVTYADTRYGDDIPGGDFVAPTGALYKLPGSRVSFAPYWSAAGSATYEVDVGNSHIARFNLGAKYMSDYNTGSDKDVEKAQDAYTVWNARIGFGARNKRWMVELWGLNLTDEDYVQVGFDAPLQNVSPAPNNPFNSFNAFLGAPRTYGMTLRITY
ncbi:outer membrane receptor protein involved in Fe transport [Lysobacter niastensis]|uniref:Outer membrane receptor protein involved in Fe transport n=1 Tax=Lysobacter niastensis TaxID=380629 RepID=A0ABU1WA12_9GAMM|nr:TonB-dependent receptor [Lysobacter niastensis]MDR7134155.1 outer membrane receptor protein involved in Fe transport [Lysobacter niastensis]